MPVEKQEEDVRNAEIREFLAPKQECWKTKQMSGQSGPIKFLQTQSFKPTSASTSFKIHSHALTLLLLPLTFP